MYYSTTSYMPNKYCRCWVLRGWFCQRYSVVFYLTMSRILSPFWRCEFHVFRFQKYMYKWPDLERLGWMGWLQLCHKNKKAISRMLSWWSILQRQIARPTGTINFENCGKLKIILGMQTASDLGRLGKLVRLWWAWNSCKSSRMRSWSSILLGKSPSTRG